MTAIPVILLFLGTAAVGLYLGIGYLKGWPRRPALIGVHILFGIGGLEVMATLLWGPTADVPVPTLGAAAAVAFVATMFIGLLAPMVGRRSRQTMNVALSLHAAAALSGIGLLLIWISSR